MLRAIYNLTTQEKLAGDGWYPLPSWLRVYLKTKPMSKRVLTLARLYDGKRVFLNVPKEVACANCVTGILEAIDPSFFGSSTAENRINGTATMYHEIVKSGRFLRLSKPENGCIVLNVTRSDDAAVRGHTGVFDNGWIWNNNSSSGKWTKSYSWAAWLETFEVRGKMNTHCFLPL